MIEKNEILSVLRMLDDPNKDVYKSLRKTIVANGKDYRQHLTALAANTKNQLVVKRVHDILRMIAMQDINDRYYAIMDAGADVIDLFVLFEEIFDSYADANVLRKHIENICNDIRQRLDDKKQVNRDELLEHLSAVIFTKYFPHQIGSPGDKTIMWSYFKLMKAKQFNTLSIVMTYTLVLSQLNVPVYPTDIPLSLLFGFYDDDDDDESDDVSFEAQNELRTFFFPYNFGRPVSQLRGFENLIDSNTHDFIRKLEYPEFLGNYYRLRLEIERPRNEFVRVNKKSLRKMMYDLIMRYAI